jgi:NAD(P)-dependent dehydrogenase (short-subunit alcohol dehydrogenase family)
MINTEDITGKISVITGGGRGIGFAIAEKFVIAGAKVIITGRNREALEAAVEKLSAIGSADFRLFDVTLKNQVDDAFADIVDSYGKVDILVNNAGVAVFKPVTELSVEEWESMINVNLTGAFFCCKAALPSMLNNRAGHIINIASVAGIKAFRGCGSYGAAKSGLLMFTKVMREEVRNDGIRVSAVIPGATNTEIWETAGSDFDRSVMMSPESIGEAVLSLCRLPSQTLVEEIILRPAEGDL